MEVIVEYELSNVAPRFKRAIWVKRYVGIVYDSAKEAKKYHNLQNCTYKYVDDNNNTIRTFNNAKLDGYGRRYR